MGINVCAPVYMGMDHTKIYPTEDWFYGPQGTNIKPMIMTLFRLTRTPWRTSQKAIVYAWLRLLKYVCPETRTCVLMWFLMWLQKELKVLCRHGIPSQYRSEMWKQLVLHQIRHIKDEKGSHYFSNLVNNAYESEVRSKGRITLTNWSTITWIWGERPHYYSNLFNNALCSIC